jgi:two-component system cell cycle sensor histidine kinase/response regulator CckA
VDITEKRKLELELQHAQKMEAVGRLAGGVAHDFNNLLMAIAGNLEYALSDLDPADPLVDPLRDAMGAAESASALTRQLLAFSRKQVTEPQILDLNDLIGKMEKLLRRLMGEDITLSTHLAGDLGLAAVDPGQFEQILANLAVNARDAMPGGGRLSLATRNVILGRNSLPDKPEARAGDFIEVSVQDSGHGMSEEVKSRLFEPFFTTKPLGKGTGLGLATVYGIMQKHGGHIRVESVEGKGTSFLLYFPRTTRPLTLAPTLAEEAMPRGSEAIYLVEDEERVRDVAVRSLAGLGYRLSVFPDAKAAITAADQPGEAPALLITDVILPGMNGRALSESLRERWPRLRVIFVSGYTADVLDQHGVLERGTAFLAKPFRLAALAQKVREVLDG